jgi:biofilm PGA synthesis N-glycosyltransferase PgaC
MIYTIQIISVIIIIYFAFFCLWCGILLISSFPWVVKTFKEATYGNIIQLISAHNLIPLTIVTPMFNEEKRILNMLYATLNSEYKNIKLILVNDGSTDKTMDLLKEECLLYEVPPIIKQSIKTSPIRHCYQSKRFKNLMVIDKEHSPWNNGADSNNTGINACQTPIMLTVDSDTILDPLALTHMVYTFLSNDHCIAVSGMVYILNGNLVKDGRMLSTDFSKRFIPAAQGLEYLRSFLYSRTGLNSFGGALCYPGAFTLFETEILRDVKGFEIVNYAYDAEMTTKLHHYMRKNRYPYRLRLSSNAFCWVETPGTLKSYWKQRDKWQRGMLRGMVLHAAMIFNPRYGIVGLLTFPAYILFDVFAPVIEFIMMVLVLVCWYLGIVSLPTLMWLFFLSWGFITYITLAVLFLNILSFRKYKKTTDSVRVLWLSFLEMLGFRQYRAICCTVATISYIINRLSGKPL